MDTQASVLAWMLVAFIGVSMLALATTFIVAMLRINRDSKEGK